MYETVSFVSVVCHCILYTWLIFVFAFIQEKSASGGYESTELLIGDLLDLITGCKSLLQVVLFRCLFIPDIQLIVLLLHYQ